MAVYQIAQAVYLYGIVFLKALATQVCDIGPNGFLVNFYLHVVIMFDELTDLTRFKKRTSFKF